MTDGSIEITQKSALGSETTQIAMQNNTYIGLSPEEASKQMVSLFMENFPKLQQLAAEVAKERVNEFCEEVLKKLKANKVTNFTPFTDPDVQYILYEAQKNYARFGTKELLSTLSDLVSRRVRYDADFFLKVVVDKAILVVNSLSAQQLDLMSLLFMCKHVKFSGIHTLEDLEKHLRYICNVFSYNDESAQLFLATMGCTQLYLVDIVKNYANMYNLNKEDVRKIIPDKIMRLEGDYGLSYTGIILAIANIEAKSKYKFDPKTWITG